MIVLGSKAKDSITGFSGIVVARLEFLYGCARYAIQPEKLKDGKTIDLQYFDEPQIIVLAPPKVPKVKTEKEPGGGDNPPKRSYPTQRGA